MHDAADPDANIIFGSVIDPNLSEEVRITVIATGFQSRVAVENSTSTMSRPTVKRPADHQMTLPMHGSHATSTVAVGSMAPGASALAPVADAVSAPVSAPLDLTDTEVEIEEADSDIHLYPPLPSLLTPAPAFARPAPFATVTPAPDSRPVIRPAVASPIAAGSNTSSRRAAPSQPGLAPSHLGIEESEYDKPTYLRRAMAGDSMRFPGDGKG